jgi:hypothetical protein
MDWYDPKTGELDPTAFAPHKQRDQTGISVYRVRHVTLEKAAQGRPGKSYYVAVLRAGDLRKAGIRVVPQPNVPTGYDPAHAELPDLNAQNRKATITLERQRILVVRTLDVHGPFETPPAP